MKILIFLATGLLCSDISAQYVRSSTWSEQVHRRQNDGVDIALVFTLGAAGYHFLDACSHIAQTDFFRRCLTIPKTDQAVTQVFYDHERLEAKKSLQLALYAGCMATCFGTIKFGRWLMADEQERE